MSAGMGHLQPLWATCASASPTLLEGKKKGRGGGRGGEGDGQTGKGINCFIILFLLHMKVVERNMVTCFRGVLQPIPAGYSIVAVLRHLQMV